MRSLLQELTEVGKHNNWSLSTDTGINLLAPTSKPKENLRFLTFLMNVVKAVHDHADLLRASISSAGNEHRLGANEAPPSIVSVFLGKDLTNMLEELVNKGEITLEKGENFYYKLGITRIPNLQRDNTDRNRTSPFCFTGNKFEYRAVGSSQNSASPMIVLNTIVANQLSEFKKEMDERLAAGEEKKVATVEILKRYFTESKNILFEGNGYSDEWIEMAKSRGLSNIRETYDALYAYTTERTIAAFEKTGVLTSRELHARYEIELENYVKKLQIESRVIGDLALNHIVSTVVKYQFKLAQTARSLTDLEMLEEANEHAHVQFVGYFKEKEVIYDALIYTLRLHHSTLVYDAALERLKKEIPNYVSQDERPENYKISPEEEEEAEILLTEFIEEIEENEEITVREHIEIDDQFEYGIGLEVGLNKTEINEKTINDFIIRFNAGRIQLDATLYSFTGSEEED
jgi:glutamine synthetase type III